MLNIDLSAYQGINDFFAKLDMVRQERAVNLELGVVWCGVGVPHSCHTDDLSKANSIL